MGRAAAYGGVVVDEQGRLLIREPKNHFDGYIWTFSKGRPDPGETPEETALRETLEETGVVAKIVKRIPGAFAGGTTDNIYFLMVPTGVTQPFEGETERIMWATPEAAREFIGQTTNGLGRTRDLTVLEAALQTLAD